MTSTDPSQPEPTPSKKRRSPKRHLLADVIIIVVLALFLLGIFIWGNPASKDTIKVGDQFVAAVQADNGSAAYNLTAPSFRNGTTQAELAQILGITSTTLQGTAQVTDKVITKVNGQPDQAAVVYSVSTHAGTKYIRVVLQDNHPWQVLSFRSSNARLGLK